MPAISAAFLVGDIAVRPWVLARLVGWLVGWGIAWVVVAMSVLLQVLLVLVLLVLVRLVLVLAGGSRALDREVAGRVDGESGERDQRDADVAQLLEQAVQRR